MQTGKLRYVVHLKFDSTERAVCINNGFNCCSALIALRCVCDVGWKIGMVSGELEPGRNEWIFSHFSQNVCPVSV
jgi:hypothetical protein